MESQKSPLQQNCCRGCNLPSASWSPLHARCSWSSQTRPAWTERTCRWSPRWWCKRWCWVGTLPSLRKVEWKGGTTKPSFSFSWVFPSSFEVCKPNLSVSSPQTFMLWSQLLPVTRMEGERRWRARILHQHFADRVTDNYSGCSTEIYVSQTETAYTNRIEHTWREWELFCCKAYETTEPERAERPTALQKSIGRRF